MKKQRLSVKAKRITYLAIIAVLVLCLTFAGIISDFIFKQNAYAVTYDADYTAYVVEPIDDGGDGLYGMPTSFEYSFVISHATGENQYTIKQSTNNEQSWTDLGTFTGMGNAAAPISDDSYTTIPEGSVVAGLGAAMGVGSNGTRAADSTQTEVDTTIKIHFDNIVMARNDMFMLIYVPGTYVFTGSLVGDKSNATSGILVVGSRTGTSQINRVYIHDLYVENRGSQYYDAKDPHYNAIDEALGDYGSQAPRTLDTFGGVNVYILGNSSVVTSNDAFLSRRPSTITDHRFTGFSGVANTGDYGKLKEPLAGRHTTWTGTSLPADEATYHEWLNAAYGPQLDADRPYGDYLDYPASKHYANDTSPHGEGEGFRTKYDKYKSLTMADWLASGDFEKDFASSVTRNAGGAITSITVSGSLRQTGPAISHGHFRNGGTNNASIAGALVIDTTGEIFSYAASSSATSTGYRGDQSTGTILLDSKNINKETHNTRLYIKNATVRNSFYSVPYNANSTTAGYSYLAGGSCVHIVQRAVTGYGEDLIAGGSFYSTDSVVSTRSEGTPNGSHLTIGDPTSIVGEGPEMHSVVTTSESTDGDGNKIITPKTILYYNDKFGQSWNNKDMTQYGSGSPYCAVMFQLKAITAKIADGDVYRRASVVFLGGEFTAHRGIFLSSTSATSNSVYDVHMLGGKAQTGDYRLQVPTSGFIYIGGQMTTSATTAVALGSAFFMRGGGETIKVFKGSYSAVAEEFVASGASIEVDALTPTETRGAQTNGILKFITPNIGSNAINPNNQDLPLFEISGGKIKNTCLVGDLSIGTGGGATPNAPLIHISGYNYAGTSGNDPEVAYGRVGYISGGEFFNATGSFIVSHHTTNDVVMTGGSFTTQPTVTTAIPSVLIGYGTHTYYSEERVNENLLGVSNYYKNAGDATAITYKSHTLDLGCVYFNGGSIEGNIDSGSLGVVYAIKTNGSKTAVFGRERPMGERGSSEDPYDINNDGIATGAGEVTKIINYGDSPMITLAPTSYENAPQKRITNDDGTVTTVQNEYVHHTINPLVIIDKVDFAYYSGGSVYSINSPAISASAIRTPTYPTLKNAGTLRLTGDLSGLHTNAGQAGKSAGIIRASVNVIELGEDFVKSEGNPYRIAIEYLNHEIAINGSIIRNVWQSEAKDFRNSFDVLGYIPSDDFSENTTWSSCEVLKPEIVGRTYDGTETYGTASYNHTVSLEVNNYEYLDDQDFLNWMNINDVYINFYTYKWVDSFGSQMEPADDGTLDNISPKNNESPNYYLYSERTDVMLYSTKTTTTQNYGSVIGEWINALAANPASSYEGEKFGDDELSTGLPKLSVAGYTHIGWTYTGFYNPQYRATNNVSGNKILLADALDREMLSDEFVKASDVFNSVYTHTLYAAWILSDPNIGDEIEFEEPVYVGEDETISGYTASETLETTTGGIQTFTRIYDANPLVLYTAPTHDLDIDDSHSYKTKEFLVAWYYATALNGEYQKIDNFYDATSEEPQDYDTRYPYVVKRLADPRQSEGTAKTDIYSFALENIVNVRDTGYYKVVVTAVDDDGLTSQTEKFFAVNITAQPMSEKNFTMPTAVYDENIVRALLNPEGRRLYDIETGENIYADTFRVVDNYGNILYGKDEDGNIIKDLYLKNAEDYTPGETTLDDTDGCVFYSTPDPNQEQEYAGNHAYLFRFVFNYSLSVTRYFRISRPVATAYFEDMAPTAYSGSAPAVTEWMDDDEDGVVDEGEIIDGMTLIISESDGKYYYKSTNFPADPVVEGYKFLGWSYDNKVYSRAYIEARGWTALFQGEHTLVAKWELDAPASTTFKSGDSVASWDSSTKTFGFVYDGSLHEFEVSGLVEGAVVDLTNNPNAITYEYYWRRNTSSGAIVNSGDTFYLSDVSSTGTYVVDVRAYDDAGRSSSSSFTVYVKISPRIIYNLTEDELPGEVDYDSGITIPSVDWDGTIKQPTVSVWYTVGGEKIYLQVGREYTYAKASAFTAQDAGTYEYAITFADNGNFIGWNKTTSTSNQTMIGEFKILMNVRVYLTNFKPPLSESETGVDIAALLSEGVEVHYKEDWYNELRDEAKANAESSGDGDGEGDDEGDFDDTYGIDISTLYDRYYIVPANDGTYPTLPVPILEDVNPAYAFSRWTYGNFTVQSGGTLRVTYNHEISIAWNLAVPSVSLESNKADDNFVKTSDTKYKLIYNYDRQTHDISAVANVAGLTSGINFTYVWRKGSTTGTIYGYSSTLSIYEFTNAGTYYITITAADADYNTSTSGAIELVVEIARKNFNNLDAASGEIIVKVPSGIYLGPDVYVNPSVVVIHRVYTNAEKTEYEEYTLINNADYRYDPKSVIGSAGVAGVVITITGINAYEGAQTKQFTLYTTHMVMFQTVLGTAPAAQAFAATGDQGTHIYPQLNAPGSVPTGYQFVGWSLDNSTGVFSGNERLVDTGDEIDEDLATHVLYAVFVMNQVNINDLGANIDKTYDRAAIIKTATVSYSLEKGGATTAATPSNVNLTYTWVKGFYDSDNGNAWTAYTGENAEVWIGATKSFAHVSDSGVWQLTVTATGLNALSNTDIKYYTVAIERATLSAVTIGTQAWDGDEKTPMSVIRHEEANYTLIEGVDYQYAKASTFTAKNAGKYSYVFTLINDNYIFDESAEGYNANGTFTAVFEIEMRVQITFRNLTPALSNTALDLSGNYDSGETYVTPTADGKYQNITIANKVVAGYTFSHWEYNGEIIEDGNGLEAKFSHTLTAVWILNAPTVTLSSTASVSEFRSGQTVGDNTDVYTLGFTYDLAARDVEVNIALAAGMKTTGASYTYTWYRVSDTQGQADEYVASTKTRSFANFTQSGTYYVTVTMTDSVVAPVTVTTRYIIVDIQQMDLGIAFGAGSGQSKTSYITATILDAYWTGGALAVNATVVHSAANTEGAVTASYQLIGTGSNPEYICDPSTRELVGVHEIIITATAGGNYKGFATAYFTIKNNLYVFFSNPLGAAPGSISITGGEYGDLLPTLYMAGYEFMGWSFTNSTGVYSTEDDLVDTDSLASQYTHTLMALWRINEAEIKASQTGNSTDNTVIHSYDGTTASAAASVSFAHNSENTDTLYTATNATPASFTARYIWTKGAEGSTIESWTAATGASADERSGKTVSFTNVAESGIWRLEVIITGQLGITKTYYEYIAVTINPRDMSEYITESTYSNFDGQNLDLGTASWDDTIKTPAFSLTYKNSANTTFTLKAGDDFTLTLVSRNGDSYDSDVKAVGEYGYIITFSGNYAGTVSALYEIEMNIKVYLGDITTALSEASYQTEPSKEGDKYYVVPTSSGLYPTLPTPVSEGYTFRGWTFGGESATGELKIKTSHTLTAVWEINTPTLSLSGNGLSEESAGVCRLEFVYDRTGHTVSALGSVGADSATDAKFSYTYRWTKDGVTQSGSLQSFASVADSGTYTITVTATDYVLAAKASTATYSITVSITAKNINDKQADNGLSYLVANAGNITWTGSALTEATLPSVTLTHIVNGTVMAVNPGEYSIALKEEYADTANIGTYTLILTPTTDNYTGTREVTFSVTSDLYVSFYSSFGGAPAQVALENGRYPTLPVPTVTPSGYTFKGWSYTNTTGVYESDDDLVLKGDIPSIEPLATHTLSAVWEMNTASISANNIATVYSGIAQTSTASLGFAPSAPTTYNVEYTWTKVEDVAGVWTAIAGVATLTGRTQSFSSVADSGVWQVTAVITGQLGIKQTVTTMVTVSITAQNMASYIADNYENGKVSIASEQWDGATKTPGVVITFNNGVTTFTLKEGEDYTLTAPAGEIKNATEYIYTITFRNNYSGEVTATFEIVMTAKVYLSGINPQLSTAAFGTTPAWDDEEEKYYITPNADGTYPTMPSLSASGYTFNGWAFGGTVIGTALSVKGTHTVSAVWTLNAPTATITGLDYDAGAATMAFVYDRASHTITASGLLGGENIGSFTYVWRKGSASGSVVSTGSALSMTNVSDSEKYYLVVTVTDGVLTSVSSAAIEVVVSITEKAISDTQLDNTNSYFAIAAEDVLWTGNNLSLTDITVNVIHKTTGLSDYTLVRGTDYEVAFTNAGDKKNTGEYSLTITAKSGNYTGTTTTTFSISSNIKVQFFTSLGKAPDAVILVDGCYPETLPLPFNTPAGYVFRGWSITNTSGEYVSDDDLVVAGEEASILGAHTLSAVWSLNTITVTAGEDISKTFDGIAAKSTAAITFSNNSVPATFSTSYIWTKGTGTDGSDWTETTGSGADQRSGISTSFTNVRDSGLWRLEVTVTGQLGLASTYTLYLNVGITQLDMAAYIAANNVNYVSETGKLSLGSAAWDGEEKQPSVSISFNNGVSTYNLLSGTDYTLTAPEGSIINAKEYDYSITFSGNFKGTIAAMFEVTMSIRISFTGLKPAYSAGSATKSAVYPTETGTYQGLSAPNVSAVTGYTFSHWVLGEEIIENGMTLRIMSSHSLTAVWVLNTPAVTVSGSNDEVVYSDLTKTYTLSFDYDRTTHQITAQAAVAGIAGGVSYTYTWYKGEINETTIAGYGASLSFANVSQNSEYNGYYYVVVSASDNVVAAAQSEAIRIYVDIKPQNLSSDKITVDIPERVWTGSALAPVISIMHGDEALRSSEYTYSADGDFISPKIYNITITSQSLNYTGTRSVQYEIVDGRRISLTTEIGTLSVSYVTSGDGKYPEFPAPTAPAGFEFLYWAYEGKRVEQGMALEDEDSHVLRAVWQLNDLVITNADDLAIDKTYSTGEFYLTAATGFDGGAPQSVSFTFLWEKGEMDGGEWVKTFDGDDKDSRTVSFASVADSGVWKLTIIANAYGYSSEAQTLVYVDIAPKSLDEGNIEGAGTVTLIIPEAQYGIDTVYTLDYLRTKLTASYAGKTLVENTDYVITAPTESFKSVDEYIITFTAAEGSNYTGSREVVFSITNTATVTFITLVGKMADGTMPESFVPFSEYYFNDPSKTLPTLVATGYTFIGWKYDDGNEITEDAIIEPLPNGLIPIAASGSHVLAAVWELNKPTVIVKDENGATISTISKVFDWNALSLEAVADIDGKTDFIFEYAWKNINTNETASGKILSLTNVAESGDWKLVVTARDSAYGIYSVSEEYYVTVTIEKVSFAGSDVVFYVAEMPYDGAAKTPVYRLTYLGWLLSEGKDFSVSHPDKGDGYVNSGTYLIVFSGSGNFSAQNSVIFEIYNQSTIYYNSALSGVSVDSLIIEGVNNKPALGDTYPNLPKADDMNGLDGAWGYTFVGWFNSADDKEAISGKSITTGGTSVSLYAKWTMNPVSVLLKHDGQTLEGSAGSFVFSAEYIQNLEYSIKAVATHDATDNIVYYYAWHKGSSFVGSTATLSVSSVANSGLYTLVVTANGKSGYSVERMVTVYVEITSTAGPAETSVTINKSAFWDGTGKSPSVTVREGSVTLKLGTDYLLYYIDTQGNATSIDNTWQVSNAGEYKIRLEYIGNYSGRLDLKFVITGWKITLRGIPSDRDYDWVDIYKEYYAENDVSRSYPILQTPNGRYSTLPTAAEMDEMAAKAGLVGFEFDKWSYGGTEVTTGTTLRAYDDHALTAVWKLKPIIIDEVVDDEADENKGKYKDNIKIDETTQTEYIEIKEKYDPNTPIELDVTPSEDQYGEGVEVEYKYDWIYSSFVAKSSMQLFVDSTKLLEDGEVIVGGGKFNPTKPGIYTVRITATVNGISTVTEYVFYVFIDPIAIEADNIKISTVTYDGKVQDPTIAASTKVVITVDDEIHIVDSSYYSVINVEYPTTEKQFRYAGTYYLTFKFDGIFYTTMNEYGELVSTHTIVKEYVIEEIRIIFDNLKDNEHPEGYKSTFDGKYPALPDSTIMQAVGYSFAGWKPEGGGEFVQMGNSMPLGSDTVKLVAQWTLLAPALSGTGVKTTYTIGGKVYLEVTASNEAVIAGYTYSWKWTKDGNTTALNVTSKGLTIDHAVANSGTYTVTVTATDKDGLTSVAEHSFTVEIEPKDESKLSYAEQILGYTGAPYSYGNIEIVIHDGSYTLEFNKDYDTINHDSNIYKYVGTYYFTVRLIGNYTGIMKLSVKIEPIEITLENEKGDPVSTNVGADNGVYADLPVLADIDGYEFIGWFYDENNMAENGKNLYVGYSHTLYAVWRVAAPTVYPLVDFVEDVTVTFDEEARIVNIAAPYVFTSNLSLSANPDPENGSYRYVWYTKDEKGEYYNFGFTGQSYSAIRTVEQSGFYKVLVYAVGDAGARESLPTALEFIVTVTPKSYEELDISVRHTTYNGSEQRPEITVKDKIGGETYTLYVGTDYEIDHGSNGYINVSNETSGGYQIILNFQGNYSGKGVEVSYYINPIAIELWETEIYGSAQLITTVYSSDGRYPALAPPLDNDVLGYKFEGWAYLGEVVKAGDVVQEYRSHSLTAKWKLSDLSAEYEEDSEGGQITAVYNHKTGITLSPIISHYFSEEEGLSYHYSWSHRRADGTSFIGQGVYTKDFSNIKTVAQSGWYKLTVYASKDGRISDTVEIEYYVDITPKPMTEENVVVEATYYTGSEIKPNITITDTVDGVSYVLIEGQEQDYYKEVSSPINAGDHSVFITFVGNYSGVRVEVVFKILPYEIGFKNLKGQEIEETYYSTATGTYPVLPTIANVTGYTFMGWEYESGESSVAVEAGNALRTKANHYLSAVWVLSAPVISVEDINETYDSTIYYTVASASHVVTDINLFFFVWSRGNEVISQSSRLEVRNVADSGEYTLTVTAVDQYGLRSVTSKTVLVVIAPKVMDSSNIEIGTVVWNGEGHAPEVEIKDGDYLLEYGKDYIIIGGKDNEYYDTGKHDVEIQFIGNYAGAGGQTVSQKFVIKPSGTIFPWWVLLLIGGVSLLLLVGLILLFLLLRKRRLNRYGMKRYVKTFLDRFDET